MKDCCVDLEIAKELKDAGFPQNSYFWWNKTRFGYEFHRQKGYIYPKCSKTAPTSDEILEKLPIKTMITKYKKDYTVFHPDIRYEEPVDSPILFVDKKLSNALAKMWLYLKKEGYIK